MDGEEIINSVRDSFISWADGPRDCPGKKFSQVETVAAIALLFRNRRVDQSSIENQSIRLKRFLTQRS